MAVRIVNGTKLLTAEPPLAPSTILELLQSCDIVIPAPCGGNGTCGKCQVLVKDSSGISTRLACQTRVEDGMEIIIKHDLSMLVEETGVAQRFPVTRRGANTYGVAVDVGTTTVVCHLHDLESGKRLATASCMNPQVIFGADVISRISASTDGKLTALQDMIVSCLDSLIDDVCDTASIDRASVRDLVLVGNTVMEHLAAGFSPETIGVSPFEPLSLFGEEIALASLCPHVYFAPAISGYVGADISAGILATSLYQAVSPEILIDIGTNGEMVLGNAKRLVCCATAAGPAFEGVGIVHGMSASRGAISQVDVVDGELEIETLGGIDPIGICGSGLVDLMSCLLKLGVVDETGYLLDADELTGPLAMHLGVVDGSKVFFLTEDHEVYLTQRDIRSLQLAKAAICGGVMTLVDAYGCTLDDIAALKIAGGFGSHLSLASAANIGLFPPQLLDRARAVGNSAGEGASAVLISDVARADIRTIAATCDYLELSTSSVFNGYYIDAMGFEEVR